MRWIVSLTTDTSQQRMRRWTTGVLLAVGLLKAAALLADPTIRLFLGDSAAYLDGARFDERLPLHRSFLYSLFIRAFVYPTASLSALLFWQTVAGAGVTLLLWTWLVRFATLPRTVAAVAACLFAVAPEQLFYERMIMAETPGLLAFAAFFVAASAYLASGRVMWLPLTALLGLVAAGLRLNYLPVVLVISLALPLVRELKVKRPGRPSSLLLHCVVATCSVSVSHGAYRQVVGTLFDVEPTYLPRAGFMRMGLVAPLIRPEHFVRAGLPGDLPDRLAHDLADPDTRQAQMWAPGGLADAIRMHTGDLEPTAAMLASLAIRDDPMGVVRLGLHTLGNYFRPIGHRELWADLGHREYPAALVSELRTHWDYDIAGRAFQMTPVSHYFAAGTTWLIACLLLTVPAALVNVLVHWRDPRRTQIVLAALVSVGLMGSHLMFVNLASYRYLQPFPFFTAVNVLPVAVTVYSRWWRPARWHKRQLLALGGGALGESGTPQ
ncbi:MAG: hypothetical protein ABR606_02890 [Vicinamibacterales bacterium]